MTSERTQLKRILRDYHKTNAIDYIDDHKLDDEHFFDIDSGLNMDINDAFEEFTNISTDAVVNVVVEKVFDLGTVREQYIFICYLRGYKIERIAEMFNLSSGTIRCHLDKILDKILKDHVPAQI